MDDIDRKVELLTEMANEYVKYADRNAKIEDHLDEALNMLSILVFRHENFHKCDVCKVFQVADELIERIRQDVES